MSDINFLDSKSLIINFLVQDFESYLHGTNKSKRKLFHRIIRYLSRLSEVFSFCQYNLFFLVCNPPIAIFVISAHLYSP